MTQDNHVARAKEFVQNTLGPACVDAFLSEYLTGQVASGVSPEDLVAKINLYAPEGGWIGRDGTPVQLDADKWDAFQQVVYSQYGGPGNSYVMKCLTAFDTLYNRPEWVHAMATNPQAVFGEGATQSGGNMPLGPGPSQLTAARIYAGVSYISNTGILGLSAEHASEEDRRFIDGVKQWFAGARKSEKYFTTAKDTNGLYQWLPAETILDDPQEETAGGQRYRWVPLKDTGLISQWPTLTEFGLATKTFDALWAAAQAIPENKRSKKVAYSGISGSPPGGTLLHGMLHGDPNGSGWMEKSVPYIQSTDYGRSKNQYYKIATANNDFVARIARCNQEMMADRLGDIIKKLVQSAIQDEHDFFMTADQARNAGPLTDAPAPFAQTAKDLKPFDAQCFLVENIRQITDFREARIAGGDKYTTFGRIANLGTSGQPGNIVSYINHGNRSDIIAPYLDICPDVYALITPYIKLYRVDYNKKPDNLKPYQEIQIPFPTFIDPTDIQNILDQKHGRFHGAGVKSFSWSLDGVQPEEVDNNISANLKLYFQTVQDLFSMNYPGGDVTAEPQAGIVNQAGYLDLILGSGTTTREDGQPVDARPSRFGNVCSLNEEAVEGASFRIKVCVGWSVPDDFVDVVSSMATPLVAAKAKQLYNAILLARTALYLQIVSHDLTFNEDGSVDLSINYQAALSGILTAPNADIFTGKTKYEQDKIDLDKQISDARNAISSAAGGTSAELGVSKGNLKRLLEKKDKLLKLDKAIKYKKFLAGLYDEGKIFSLPVTRDALETGLLKDLDPEARARAAVRRKQVGDMATTGVGNPQDASAADVTDQRVATNAAIAASSGGETTENEARFQKFMLTQGANRFVSSGQDPSEAQSADIMDFPFFFVGDFIDIILRDLGHLTNADSFQLLLGNVEIIDPLLAFQVDNIVVDCGGAQGTLTTSLAEVDPLRFGGLNRIIYSTNISNLPISLEYFQNWFLENVVKPQRGHYPLLTFIKDICASLIGRCFNTVCFGEVFKFNLKFDTATFTLQNTFRGDMFVDATEVAKAKGNADFNSVRPLLNGGKPLIPTALIYSVGSKPLTGDYMADMQNGIYHYFMGARCGLAKKINFIRNDMPYYREARLQRRGSLSADQLRELYSVSIDMVGNTLHRNGQYIYVEPVGIGVGSLRAQGGITNLAKRLGFGGYYMISKVENTVTDGGFDTVVHALQEGINFNQNKVVGGIMHISGADLYEGQGAPPDQNPNTVRLTGLGS